MIRITDILDIVTENNPHADLDIIDRAYVYSARVHSGQVRLSGEPYLSHPLEVSGILAKMKLDPISVASGLLHDVIEDTHANEEEIDKIFGSNVRHIVSGVTKLSKFTFCNSKARAAESFRKMLLAMADDIRVILIKLADRLHNMRTLQFHKSESKKREISRETLNIYAPIALRLGIYWIKTELEDTSLIYLNNSAYKNIKELIEEDKEQRKDYIEISKKCIKEVLDANNLSFRMIGRYKSIYSIYHKMERQNIPFESVHDVVALRVILKTPEDCYNALGCIHGCWKPVPDRIKDYIGMPKPNMYQSLHTTVIGLYGKRMEIQIRTEEMDKVAKSGIAAHWGYKEGQEQIDERSVKTFKWLQDMIENQRYTQDPDELLEALRIDLFPDDVYVFTPEGDIKSLPRGATPIDFAYSIHSEVGNQCFGCKVNGRIVPLHYQLRNGEVVEIITNKDQTPNKDWLKFVKTVKARSRVRQDIKNKERKRSISLGREMCEKAFNAHKLNFNNLIKQDDVKRIIKNMNFSNIDDLTASVGYGKITPRQLVSKIISPKQQDHKSLLNKIISKVRRKDQSSGVTISGCNDMLIRFGKCCQPIPGDQIMGYITRGQGVTIHRTNCINVITINLERRIDAGWGVEPHETYPVSIVVNCADKVGLLANISGHISRSNVNIMSADAKVVSKGNAACYFTISAKNTEHLNKLISSIKKIAFVTGVKRTN